MRVVITCELVQAACAAFLNEVSHLPLLDLPTLFSRATGFVEELN